MTWLLFLAVGFILGKMPAEFWTQMRTESGAAVQAAWAWLKSKFKRGE